MRMIRRSMPLLPLFLAAASLLVLATMPAPAKGRDAGLDAAPGGCCQASRAMPAPYDAVDAQVQAQAQAQAQAQDDPYPVHELTSLAMLRDQFNHDFGRPRLILFLSPT